MQPSTDSVLFLHDFDDTAAEIAPVPPPEPEIIEDDQPCPAVEEAPSKAFEEGYRLGRDTAADEHATNVAASLHTIATLLEDAAKQAAEIAGASAEALVKLFVEIIGAGYPNLRARYGEQEVQALMRKVLPALTHEPEVLVQVHPTLADAAAAELAAFTPPLHDRVSVAAAAWVPPGDARITWKDGAAIREASKTWEAVADILGPLGLLTNGTQAARSVDLE